MTLQKQLEKGSSVGLLIGVVEKSVNKQKGFRKKVRAVNFEAHYYHFYNKAELNI